ncbi:hypothetical protein ABT336_14720 [Micromonospora sp. NPDC000207]|uniref:hypothetical protein n=1 Tax=Micromonospora sp. NPDC000207 TaxID=3154246 RepID=UPI0033279DAA
MGRTTSLRTLALAAAITGVISVGAAAAQADPATPATAPTPTLTNSPTANHPWD